MEEGNNWERQWSEEDPVWRRTFKLEEVSKRGKEEVKDIQRKKEFQKERVWEIQDLKKPCHFWVCLATLCDVSREHCDRCCH